MDKGPRVDGGQVETVFQRPDIDSPRELTDAIPGRTTPVRDDVPTPARG
jgi:hypothetical protein